MGDNNDNAFDLREMMKALFKAQAANREALAENRRQNERLERAYKELGEKNAREGDQRPPTTPSSAQQLQAAVINQPVFSLHTLQVTHLTNASNYDDWKGGWGNHLAHAKLQKYVLEDVKSPPEGTPEAEVWEEERSSVYAALYRTTRGAKEHLSQNGYDDDPADRNPYNLWEAARVTFAPPDMSVGLDVWLTLSIIRRGTFSWTYDFLNEFMRARKRIMTTRKVNDLDIAMFLLNAVRDSHPGIYRPYGDKQKEIKWLDMLHNVNALKGKENRPENGPVSIGFPALDQRQPAPQPAPQQPPQPPKAPSKGPQQQQQQPKLQEPEKERCRMCEQHHRTRPNGTCWKFYPESVPMNRGNYGATMRAIDHWRKSDRGKALMQRARDRGEYDRPDHWNGPELGAFAIAAPEPDPEPQPTLTPAPGYLPPSNWISLIDPFDIEQRATALQGQPETVSDLTLLNQTDPYEPPVCLDDIIWDTGC
ncbi:hypothetical protein IMZ48_29050 [Candidatus Bathyarchaeota archaeon]|nr:hypothetical protein [Candidatus Bathyarchaeota archaeon]